MNKKEAVKCIIEMLVKSMKLHEESYSTVKGYQKTKNQCHLQVAEGDELVAIALGLFDDWPNDIQDLAKELGI